MGIDPTIHSAAPCRTCGEPRGDHKGGKCPKPREQQVEPDDDGDDGEGD